MAKKCLKCEFPDNPDDAHYCGECGEPLDRFSWGKMARYSLIEVGTLEYLEETKKKYKVLEQKYNRTLEARLNNWRERFHYWWKFTGQPLMDLLLVVMGIVFGVVCFYLAFTS